MEGVLLPEIQMNMESGRGIYRPADYSPSRKGGHLHSGEEESLLNIFSDEHHP